MDARHVSDMLRRGGGSTGAHAAAAAAAPMIDELSLDSFGAGRNANANAASATPRWSGAAKVDHEAFQRMASEHRAARATQHADQLKIRQLAAQLARTEEAAKRALVRGDLGARGGAAQALLDAQRELDKSRGAVADLSSRLAA